MLFSLLVSLFTSRVILEGLGVSDYGTYNLVGGVVAMLSFLNSSMAGATSRFITYEIGNNKDTDLKVFFSSAMSMHLIIVLIVLILAETIGLWFLNKKLVIPDGTMFAANVVYQVSIFTTILSLTQTPYTAVLIAEERMKAFAYFDILATLLKLGIAYLLFLFSGNRLILYSIFMGVVSVGMMMIYRIYCIHHFYYSRFSFNSVRRDVLSPMLKFSGWDLIGNLSVIARTQGISMLVNIFFTTIANAAIGIANQIQGALNGFATNVTLALKPQIIKSYASGNYEYMSKLLFFGAKSSYLIILILSLPVLIETDFILHKWLVVVPEYTVWITRLTIGFIFFSNMSFVLVTGVHATGDIRPPSIINGSLYLMVVPITYIAYKLHSTIYIPFIVNVLFVFIGALTNFYYTRRYVRILSINLFFKDVIFRCFVVTILSAIFPILVSKSLDYGWLRFIMVTLISLVTTISLSYLIGADKYEKKYLEGYINKLRIKLIHG